MPRGHKYSKQEIDDLLDTVKPFLILGYSLRKACINAEIPESTIKTLRERHLWIRRKIAAWRNLVNTRARQNIVKQIAPSKKEILKGAIPNVELSKWWAERREKSSFSTRQEIGVEESNNEHLETLAKIHNEVKKITNPGKGRKKTGKNKKGTKKSRKKNS